eukprot:scaffold167090_cov14-Tisochrysis_lutea.AAC.1
MANFGGATAPTSGNSQSVESILCVHAIQPEITPFVIGLRYTAGLLLRMSCLRRLFLVLSLHQFYHLKIQEPDPELEMIRLGHDVQIGLSLHQ